jgi:hypothetical protein
MRRAIVFVALLLGGVAAYLYLAPGRGYRLDDKSKVELEVTADLIQRFRASRGRLPTSDEGLPALVREGLATEANLTDPWGKKLIYRCTDSQCRSAKIYSTGPNQQDEQGGGDDITRDVR